MSERRLAAAGFARTRVFWSMQRPLTAADERFEPAPGVRIRAAALEEAERVHALVEAAFADHWNHHERTFAEWWEQQSTRFGFDPSLWWVAELDGHVAGVLLASRQMAGDDAIYVATLATLRADRGRGVATSLLRQAFAEGRAQGWSQARLHVDAQSTTAAPAVYAGVGLEVTFAMNAWQRTVAAG